MPRGEGEDVFLPKKRKPPDIDDSQVITKTAVAAATTTAAATALIEIAVAAAAAAAAATAINRMAVAAAAAAAAAAAVTKIAVAAAAKVAAAAAVNSIAVAAKAAAKAIAKAAAAAAAAVMTAVATAAKAAAAAAVIPNATPSLGNRKDTRAHAPGVSTLFQIAPSPVPLVRPLLFLRLPTRCTRSGHHRNSIAVAAAAATKAAAAAAAAVMTAVATAAKAAAAAAVIPTATPSLGNRKDTRAHAPGVSTLFQIAPSPVPLVRPLLFLRLPTRCTRSGHHRGEHQQTCLSKLQLLQLSISSMQEHCNDTRVSRPGREHLLPGQLAISSAQPSVLMQPPSTPDRSAQNRV